MSGETLKLIFGGMLLLHGVAHVGAIGALAWIEHFGPGSTGGWLAARSWLAPDLASGTAASIAYALWAISLAGFVAAGLAFFGFFLPGQLWRPLALGSAIVSAAGIVAFAGTWPAFNATAALAANVAAVAGALWLAEP